MEKIIVKIGWSGNNYSCVTEDNRLNGIVIATDKKLDVLKSNFRESLLFHIEGCVRSGDKLPEWLINGEYEFDYKLEVSALLHSLDGIVTRSAIARVTGINERQIGHYALGIRNPRPEKRQQIIEGIHTIGSNLISVV